jgi:hypothetical protein
LVSLAAPDWVGRLDPRWQWLQFLPLVLVQAAAMLSLWWFGLRGRDERIEAGSEKPNPRQRVVERPAS